MKFLKPVLRGLMAIIWYEGYNTNDFQLKDEILPSRWLTEDGLPASQPNVEAQILCSPSHEISPESESSRISCLHDWSCSILGTF